MNFYPSVMVVLATMGILAGGAGSASAQEDSLQKVIDGGVLRVAAEPETPPMLFKTGERYDGFDFAVARAIARLLGVQDVVIVPGKYSELPARLIDGKADVIVSGYTADDSISGVVWSEPYYEYGLCLVVKKGGSVRSLADLAGRVVGIFNDPAAEEVVEGMRIGYSRLEKYEDGYFGLLAEGKLDGFIYDYPYAQEEIKEYPGQLEIVQFNLSSSTYNVGVRRGSDSLLRRVNAAIKSLRASPEYGQMIRKYLGESGPAPVPQVIAGQRVYTVRPGDTLSKIARDQLGRFNRWTEIWELNKGRIADPHLISIGWELVLPER